MKVTSCWLLLVACFIGSFAHVNAQQPGGSYTLKGRVVDSGSGLPLEFATVALKKMRDSSLVSGTITNPTGNFILSDLPAGGYVVEIAFIGYERHTAKIIFRSPNSAPVTDLGDVKLQLSAKMLEGAEITAEKSFVMNNIDRKTYNTEQLAVTTGGNANDILENLPSVELDAEGNVSLRGNENVTILIDGRPSGLTGSGGKSLLESMPASAIEKVEIITNPSAKYDPDGISGIINIVTKKNKLTGLTGNVGVTTQFDKGYGANASVSYRHGKLNVYSNLGYNNTIRNPVNRTYRETFFEDVTSVLDQEGKGESENNSFSAKLGIDYNLTDKSTLSASALLNNSYREYNEFLWYHYLGNQLSGDSLYRRDAFGTSDDQGFDLDLAFRQYFRKPGRVLNLQATGSINTEEETDKYRQLTYLDASTPDPQVPIELQNDLTNESHNIYTFSADYEHPIGEDRKIETGVKGTLREIDNDFGTEYYDETLGTFVNNLNLNNRFKYNDGVYAFYAQYRQSVGKFGIQAGLRSEYATRESELINTGETFTKDYYSLFPSIFLSWKPDLKWQVKVSYSRRINRPRTQQLNPFTSYEDPLNIRTGNPGLDPEYTDSYEVEGSRILNKFTITATAYYRYTHDYIQRYRIYDPATGIAVVTFENINNAENYGAEFIINGNVFKWWTFTLSSNIYQNVINASNLQSNLTSSDIAFSSRIFTTFKLPYQFDLQLNYFYRAPFDMPQGRLKEMQHSNIAISKKVLKEKGTITFRVSDPFDNQRFGIVMSDPNYRQDMYRRRDTRTFTLGFSWRFGELRDRDARKRNGNEQQQQPREEMDMGF